MRAASTARGGDRSAARLWARATAGRIDFDSTRNFTRPANGAGPSPAPPRPSGTASSTPATGGHVVRGAHGAAQRPPERLGRILQAEREGLRRNRRRRRRSTSPSQGRTSDETRGERHARAWATTSMGRIRSRAWLRVELEGGRRQILSGSLGHTTASFEDGDPFTLDPEKRNERLARRGCACSPAVGPSRSRWRSMPRSSRARLSIGGRASVSFKF